MQKTLLTLLATVLLALTASVYASHAEDSLPSLERFRRQDIFFPGNPMNLNLESQPCNLPYGRKGTCRRLSNCSPLRGTIRTPKICEYRPGDPVVCCPMVAGGEKILEALPQDCGRSISFSIKEPFIIGNTIRQPHKWPWMVALGIRDASRHVKWFCGGALINTRYVITAAHCLIRKPTVVRLGDLDLRSGDDDDDRPIDVAIESTLPHPEFNHSSRYYDIGLVRLREPIKFSINVRPICLPPSNSGNINGQQVIHANWRYPSIDIGQGDILEEIPMYVVNQFDCVRRYQNTPEVVLNFPNGIMDHQMCAGVPRGGRTDCPVDSGGALVYFNSTTKRYGLMGIASGGLGCDFQDFPALFARVNNFFNWIRDNVTS